MFLLLLVSTLHIGKWKSRRRRGMREGEGGEGTNFGHPGIPDKYLPPWSNCSSTLFGAQYGGSFAAGFGGRGTEFLGFEGSLGHLG